MSFEEFVKETEQEGIFIVNDNTRIKPYVGNSKSVVEIPRRYWQEAMVTDAYPKERKKLLQRMITDKALLLELFKAYQSRIVRRKR